MNSVCYQTCFTVIMSRHIPCQLQTVSRHMQALHTYLSKLRLKMSHQEKENGGKAEDILVSNST